MVRKLLRPSRRSVLRYGLAGGSAAIIGSKGFSQSATASPPTTPFIEPLPIAPIARPVAPFATQADPTTINVDGSTAYHVRGPRQVPAKTNFYNVTMQPTLHSFHRQLPLNSAWGYNGSVPGPTFISTSGTASLIRFVNNLPKEDPVGIGEPIAAIHHHGGYQAPEDDGYPLDTFAPGQSRDYLYPNVPEEGLVQNETSTTWYHDHAIDTTAENVYRGLAGFYLNFDSLDSLLGEEDPNPRALRLPGRMRTLADGSPFREYDIPIVFQDKSFNSRGFLTYDSFDHNGFIGDKFLANGKIQPFLRVDRRKYRFRFLNGSNARVFELFLQRAMPFDYVIASDDHLFEFPLRNITSIRMAPGERYEVVIDFSRFPTGTEIVLENRLEQKDGRKPAGLVSNGTPLMKFIVGNQVADPSFVPGQLRPLSVTAAQMLAQVKVRRTFEFGRNGGVWAINNQLFDENRIDARPKIGVPEIWTLKAGGGWLHPIHIHNTTFFILSRNGKQPGVLERGRKDLVRIGADEGDVDVLFKYTGYTGRYAFHCHTIEHEDMRMMGQVEIQA